MNKNILGKMAWLLLIKGNSTNAIKKEEKKAKKSPNQRKIFDNVILCILIPI